MKFRTILRFVYVSTIIILLVYIIGIWKFIDSISLSNEIDDAYKNSTKLSPWKFALKKEHWVFVHFIVPFQFSVFIVIISLSICLIYGWESYEAISAVIGATIVIINKWTSSYFSEWIKESAGDSLVGDILIGTTGVLYSRYIMWMYFPCINELLRKGPHQCSACKQSCNVRCIYKRHRIFFLFLLNFLSGAWCELMAGVVFHYKVFQIPHTINIGFLLYPFCRLLWADIFWYQALPHLRTHKTHNEVDDFIYMITFVFFSVYLSAVFLTALTYPVVFIGVGVSFLLLTAILSRRRL